MNLSTKIVQRIKGLAINIKIFHENSHQGMPVQGTKVHQEVFMVLYETVMKMVSGRHSRARERGN